MDLCITISDVCVEYEVGIVENLVKTSPHTHTHTHNLTHSTPLKHNTHTHIVFKNKTMLSSLYEIV